MVGNDFVLGAGTTVTSSGFFPDHVIASGGTIQSDRALDLENGLEQSAGLVDLGYAPLIVNDFISNISGGELIVSSMHIGWDGDGRFTQTGGTVTITGADTLIVGQTAGDVGTYLLESGTLNTTGGAVIGQAGDGWFIHTGGTHTVDNVTMAQTGGSGTYLLDGGRLVAADLTAGADARRVPALRLRRAAHYRQRLGGAELQRRLQCGCDDELHGPRPATPSRSPTSSASATGARARSRRPAASWTPTGSSSVTTPAASARTSSPTAC